MVYRARGQLGVGGVGGLSDLRGGKRTSLKTVYDDRGDQALDASSSR